MDADLTPAQYRAGKSIASKFCEARDDGLSLNSAIAASSEGVFRRILFSGIEGDILKSAFEIGREHEEMTDEERDNAVEEFANKYYENLGFFILNKVQKDCPLNKQDFDLAKSGLNELLLSVQGS